MQKEEKLRDKIYYLWELEILMAYLECDNPVEFSYEKAKKEYEKTKQQAGENQPQGSGDKETEAREKRGPVPSNRRGLRRSGCGPSDTKIILINFG